MKYKAFISYSHRDALTANWLHRRLDGYRPPRLNGAPRETRWRVFLDREELGASSNLSERIQRALDESETLVVLCSPDAARSRHVSMEVAYFRQLTDRNILFAIVDGTPYGEDDECMPEELQKLPNEPLGVDLRKNDKSEAFLKIASGIMKIDYGDLANRERKRSIRRTVLGACIVGLILFLAAGAATIAIVQTASIADRVAEAKTLGGLRYAEDRDVHNAERMFRESLYISDSQIARQGLIRALQKSVMREARWVTEGAEFTSVAFVTDSHIAVGDKAGNVRLIDPKDGAELWSVAPVGPDAAASPLAINDLIYDETASRIIAAGESGFLFWLDPATGATEDTFDAGHAVLSLRQSRDSDLLALGTRGGLLVLDRNEEQVIDMIHGHAGTVQGIAFNRAGDTIYWGGSTKQIWACQINTNPCQQLQYVDEWVYSIDTDRAGRFSAHGEGGKVTLLDHFLQRGEAVARGGAHVFALRFDPTETLLVAGDSNGRIAVYDVRAQTLIQATDAGDGQIYDIAFSSSGKHFASAGLDGVISVWQLTSDVIPAPTYSKFGARNPAMLAREQPTAIHDIKIFDDHAAVITDSQTRQHVLPLFPDEEVPEYEHDERLFAERALRSQRESHSLAWAASEIDTVAAWGKLHPERSDVLNNIEEDSEVGATTTSSDAHILAVVNSGKLWLFSAGSDTPRTMPIGLPEVTSLAIADSGEFAYLGTSRGEIAVLETSTGKIVDQIECDNSNVFAVLSFAGGKQAVAATADGALCLINEDGRLVRRIETSIATAFAGATEFDVVAIAGVEGSVRLFTSALELVTEFNGHRGSVNALHFSADDRVLFSGGEDEVLRSWPAGDAISIFTQPWDGLLKPKEEQKSLHKELPVLWPSLRWVGYL